MSIATGIELRAAVSDTTAPSRPPDTRSPHRTVHAARRQEALRRGVLQPAHDRDMLQRPRSACATASHNVAFPLHACRPSRPMQVEPTRRSEISPPGNPMCHAFGRRGRWGPRRPVEESGTPNGSREYVRGAVGEVGYNAPRPLCAIVLSHSRSCDCSLPPSGGEPPPVILSAREHNVCKHKYVRYVKAGFFVRHSCRRDSLARTGTR